jgi:2-polyprenyl-3-methyl-5-hydroxy-6-metoxy-1,4-benzoquinol methylase
MDIDAAAQPRYDEIADWYLSWTDTFRDLVCDPAIGYLPKRLDGQRCLDVACGAGRTSRELARRGASVRAVELSSALVAEAEEHERRSALGITYRVGNIARLDDWWDGSAFDGATCEMAFMDIDDLDGAVAAVSATVRAGALFAVSMLHPCFPGNAPVSQVGRPSAATAARGTGHQPSTTLPVSAFASARATEL